MPEALNPITVKFAKYRKLYLAKCLNKKGKKIYKRLYKLWLQSALRIIDTEVIKKYETD